MPFAYYDRLSPSRQAIYRKSDAIVTLALPAGIDVAGPVRTVEDGLVRGHRATVQAGSQSLVGALVRGFEVPRVAVRVLAVRPSDHRRRASRPLRAERGSTACPHLCLDEHRAAKAGGRVPLVRPHARARDAAPPRLRALSASRKRSTPRASTSASRACPTRSSRPPAFRRPSPNRAGCGKIRVLPEERCNPPRVRTRGPGSGLPHLQPRSLNRDSLAG